MRFAASCAASAGEGTICTSIVAGQYPGRRSVATMSAARPPTGTGAPLSATSASELRRGVIAGLAVYTVWGLLTVYWKQLHRFRPLELVGWRIATAAVMMAGIATVTRAWRRIASVVRQPRLLGWVAAAAAMLTVNWTAYVAAVTADRVLETALGYFIAPLLTMALGVVVLRERLSRLQRGAIALATAAIAVLAVSYGEVPWLALAIAASWASYSFLKRQVPLSPVDSMAVESLLLGLPAAILVVATQASTRSVSHQATAGQWVLVLMTGLITVVPLIVFAYAAHRVPLTLLGPMNYTVPTINFLLGWLAYGERLTASATVGFVLVWAALAMITADVVRAGRIARPSLR